MFHAVVSTSASARLAAARRFLSSHPPAAELLVIAASRGAADDLVRELARHAGATFGVFRASLAELAARALVSSRGLRGHVTGSLAASEAIASRAVFDALAAEELAYFAPVARTPGFPRALARTLHELRLANVPAARLASQGTAEQDLGALLARVEAALAAAAIDDRAAVFAAAAAWWRTAKGDGAGVPCLLLDLTIDSPAEQSFVKAIIDRAPAALATVPDGDERARVAYGEMGAVIESLHDAAASDSDLVHLRRFVFANADPPQRERSGDVRLFSAPGEGRETVEIVRRVLDEASRGVRFDQMAVLLRTPQQYMGLLEHACTRADVPAYFDRGTRRPDPAGRAFIALLSCAVERLSARRFDEYLSLGQVPRLGPAAGRPPAVPSDELFTRFHAEAASSDDPETAGGDVPVTDSDEEAIVAGTLRSPWKWEELIVESAVVGGQTREDGKQRWRRRLKGLDADFELRISELTRDEPDSPKIARLRRDRLNLRHLRAFALPIIDRLAAWPEQASWGEWLALLSDLAKAALNRPDRVLAVLADLRPMASVGPVTLEGVRDALHERLVTLDWDPPARRYGRLFIGTPHQARGREFRVVFVPGLAERVVPQRPREDPLLLDERRQGLEPSLLRQEERGLAERLLLKLAIGTASERLYLSYPRMDVAETRARVPSFYALDVVRAMTGAVPDHRVLATEAAEESSANLAWPAPQQPQDAIDDLEHDLAVLRPMLDARDAAAMKGRAHYLLGLNDALARSIRGRWKRDQKAWSSSDGLCGPSPVVAPALRRHRLGAREYSLSALQRYAGCPYQFFLATIHRLQPWEEPEPLVRMDPLTRGSLFHKVQADFYRAMELRGRLPVTADGLPEAMQLLHRALDAAAEDYREKLAPAIERVWRDEIGELRRDLGIWIQRIAREESWEPKYFEFSFGLNDEGRDPRSLKDPITIGDRFRLRGSVDLIEQHRESKTLRITDHKTGRNRSTPDLIVGGGKVLQPVLYSVAIEKGLETPVSEGRLFYCTTVGGFAAHPVKIDEYTRTQGLQVLEIIDRAVDQGFLVAAPADRECAWCDFRPVCGPREEERTRRKHKDRLADLAALRGMR